MFCYVSLDLNVLEFNTVPIMMSVNIHVYLWGYKYDTSLCICKVPF